MIDKVFTIVMIIKSGDIVPSFSLETIGVYSSYKMAHKYIKELELQIPSKAKANTHFDVIGFNLDAEPDMLDIFKDPDGFMDIVTSVYKGLMDDGYMDQLVGEDGNFYWVMTDKGYEALRHHRKEREEE